MINGHMLQDLMTQPKTVGLKQTIKAVNSGEAYLVFVAQDAVTQVKERVTTVARANSIRIEYVDSMTELGKACNVEVKTATAALINE
ncbi:ribosomal L7Ae/L30e/S12e/Gadd45 family protein [Vallitalea okinawensis]|uniref:ribosomal L7Ae/L30e/S12e/Gadd45 family protein n=1 Tax=Vallitalea okinawensis TaxID=2078660 RepID=UPI001FA85811|nr:ribosomal L7Ae/L30e/S12e/Gadd45 family protein [Vallitalea okinawensis]